MFLFIKKYLENTGQIFNEFNAHRLIAGSIVLAQKFYTDEFLKLKYYGEFGGVALSDISAVEKELAERLNWELTVSKEQLEICDNYLCRAAKALHIPFRPTYLRQKQQSATPSSYSKHRFIGGSIQSHQNPTHPSDTTSPENQNAPRYRQG